MPSVSPGARPRLGWGLAACRKRGGEWIASGQCGRDLQCRSGTFRRIFFQAAQNYALDERVQIFYKLRWNSWRALIAQARHFFARRRVKRPFTGEYFVEHQTERVEIALRCQLAARKLFGRHVRG